MAPALRIYFQWFLFLLCVGFLSVIILARTNTEANLLNESSFEAIGKFDGQATLKKLNANKARSLKCVPMLKHFEVQLAQPLQEGEGVGLTGDHTKLGEWQIAKSLEMRRRKRRPLNWYLKIPMCSPLRIHYRFFVYYKDSRGMKHLRYWESQQHARVMEAYEIFRHQGSQTFGEAHVLAFGGGIQQEKSWLRREYIIQLKLIWPQHIRFTEFSRFIRQPKYILKLKAYSGYSDQTNYEKAKLDHDTQLKVSNFFAQESKLKTLTESGEFYQNGDIVVIHITAVDFLQHLYILGIYTREEDLLGEVVILPKSIRRSEGILELPIHDVKEHRRVGWITLPYLRVKAFPKALKFNMRASFHHYWPYNWPTLDIGQRGLGKSFRYHSSNAIENTIAGFLKAQELKTDMIQLNVQLTKDYVPIVWHDFGFFTIWPIHDKKFKGDKLTYVYIHDLTYEQLKKKPVFMLIKGFMVDVTHLNTVFVPDKDKIFPLLEEVFKALSPTLGIMMDIKWPQLLSSGSFESLQSLDKNHYVDEVLTTTTDYGCGRPLILASFDADICTMLRFKQHMYPVVFFTLGQHSPWQSFADLRTQSLKNAILFAQASDILGTSVYAKEIISGNNKEDVNKAFELQQLLFVWGDELNDASVQEHFRKQEMAGLIYDRIDSFLLQQPKMKRKRFGFFEAQELRHIFLRQCIASGNLSISEGLPDTHSPFFPRFRSFDEL